MHRRAFLSSALGALATHLAAEAQQTATVPRIVLIFANTPVGDLVGPQPPSPYLKTFLETMRELGWVDGKNITIERVSAEGQPDRFAALVDEAITRSVDLMMITGPHWAVQRARQARDTMPIVLAGTNDPDNLIQLGLIKSLARPGGSVTGLTTTVTSPEIRAKRLQLLTEVLPGARRVAYLGAPTPLSARDAAAARALNVTLLPVEVTAPEEFEKAFAAVMQNRVDSLFVSDSQNFFWGHRHRIVEFAARQRLPAMYYNRIFTDSGGLASYGTDYLDIYRRAATYVDRILKGAKPGELPIEQPTKFQFAINLKTAKALGLTIPQSLLLRADHIIEQ